MPGETDVINAGLRKIGAKPIISLTDGSDSANAVGDVYEELRDDLLRSHPWNFATKRVKMAQSSVIPVSEYDFAYPLPSNWLRTISVHNNDAGHGVIPYSMENHEGQNSILTSSDEVWLVYVHRVTDPNLMIVDFRTALEFTIARDMSIPLASSNTLWDKMETKANRATAKARSSDAQGSTPKRRPQGSFVTRRFRGLRNRYFIN